jgi:hypothetical protein
MSIPKGKTKMEGLTMTRFQRELSGELGAFWQQHAKDELAKVKADLDSGEITIDEAGIARNCIGRALMDDLLEKLLLVTDKADSAATRAAREAEVKADLESYRARPPAPRNWPRCGPLSARGQRWWTLSPARKSNSDISPGGRPGRACSSLCSPIIYTVSIEYLCVDYAPN